MIGIIMAGGRGTRMGGGIEKLLLRYKKPAILHVADSLTDSGCFERIVAATSPNSPDTKRLLESEGIETFETSGEGYVEDLNCVLRSIRGPALVTSGDLPLLDGNIIQKVLQCRAAESAWTSIIVSQTFLESLGLDVRGGVEHEGKTCCYSGISVVNSDAISSLDAVTETRVVMDDRRLAFNLNTPYDYDLLGAA